MDDEGIRGALPTSLVLRRERELIQQTLNDVRDELAPTDTTGGPVSLGAHLTIRDGFAC